MSLVASPGLTPRQRDVLDFVIVHIEEYGYPPTIREIAVGIGISSNSTESIYGHLHAMARKGAIVLDGHARSRSLRIPGVRWQMVRVAPEQA